MATDYDAPRTAGPEETDELLAIDTLTSRRPETSAVDEDSDGDGDTFELPGADLSGEELTVRVIPKKADEFTCASCFLVHHRSRLAHDGGGHLLCRDCAD